MEGWRDWDSTVAECSSFLSKLSYGIWSSENLEG